MVRTRHLTPTITTSPPAAKASGPNKPSRSTLPHERRRRTAPITRRRRPRIFQWPTMPQRPACCARPLRPGWRSSPSPRCEESSEETSWPWRENADDLERRTHCHAARAAPTGEHLAPVHQAGHCRPLMQRVADRIQLRSSATSSTVQVPPEPTYRKNVGLREIWPARRKAPEASAVRPTHHAPLTVARKRSVTGPRRPGSSPRFTMSLRTVACPL